MNTARFPALRPNDRCGTCGNKIKRLSRLEPMTMWCARCGMFYAPDGTCTGYNGSGMTHEEWDYRQAARARALGMPNDFGTRQ